MPNLKDSSLPIRIVIGILGSGIVILAVVYLFYLRTMIFETYLYFLIALALPIVFFSKRIRKETDVIPWYDLLICLIGLGFGLYAGVNALHISLMGWEFEAPNIPLIGAILFMLTLLESARRTFGWVIFILCAFFTFEPMFASVLPGPFEGLTFSFKRVMSFHAFSRESVLGPVSSVCGRLLVGYLLYAGVLQGTGGGRFLLDLGLCLFGKTRGAPAKVSVVSSGLFGMVSGAPIANILVTGAFTVPAMKRGGYAPHYAASVEACASTGGAVLPPVMGSSAFVMAEFLGLSYWEICKAAVLPAILYFFILFIQADAYAGRMGLGGLKKEEIPKFWPTMKKGFPFFFSLCVLIYFLAWERRDAQAPFFAVLALLFSSLILKETRPSLGLLWKMFEGAFKLIANLFTLLYTLSIVVGALTLTGVLPTLSYGLVDLVGGRYFFLPLVAMGIGYILGMGTPGVAVYILLATSVAPALKIAGFSPLPAHMLCLYVGMLSIIIPPVALGSITAGTLVNESNVFKLGFTSMRLGLGLFVLPFIFAFSPSIMIGQAPFHQTATFFFMTLAGFFLISSAFENYLFRFNLRFWQAALVFLCGVVMIYTPNLIF